MNTRFLEIYSYHRDRTQFPLISSFLVPFSPTPMVAQDPNLNGPIYFTWSSDYKSNIFYPLKSGSTSSSPKLYISNAIQQPDNTNYYTGYTMIVRDSSTGSMQMRVITEYDPVELSVALNNAFSFPGHEVSQGDLYSIFEMNTPSIIHLPLVDQYGNVAQEYSQVYNGYYIMDETLSYGRTIVARQIIDYDFKLRYCYLDTPFPSSWGQTDSYTLRKSLPLEKWTLSTSTFLNQEGFYVFTLPVEANASNSYYIGKYIYFSSHVPSSYDINQFKPIYGIYEIVKYDGFTRRAYCRSSVANNPEQPPTVNDTINIVTFYYNNFSPLFYNGSIVSQNQTVCYEIALLSLILPNVTLKTGSRIAFYPYVYVELANATAPSGASKDLIYSNNPQSNRAMFIVHITDVVQPLAGRFVKLVGRMRQTVKFKPNDNLRFSVYLPDGEPFEPLRDDLYSPYEPDISLQINAVFALRRL